jgi:hypothetical protein
VTLQSPPQRLVFLALLPAVVACAPDWKPSQLADAGEAVTMAGDAGAGDDAESSPGGEGGTRPNDAGGPNGSDSDGGDAPDEGDGSTGPAAACNAGVLRCSNIGSAVEICTAANGWQTREPCGSVCVEGVCRGDCHPGDAHCALNQTPETCDAMGQWVAGSKCMHACTGDGECTGVCTPGSKRCDPSAATVPQVCDESGQWVSAAACPAVCSSGTCGGSCMPGKKQCGANNTPELCSAMGTWEPQTACEFVCSGAGECTGECEPGARDCDQQTPRTCDQTGKWKSDPACSNSACVAGSCAGRCTPGTTQCGANETPQTCSPQGQWQSGARCPFVCTGAGSCTGQCTPNQKTCSSNTLRTCRADSSGYNDQVCQPAQTGETASCSSTSLTCTSACQAIPGSCTGSNKCWSLPFGCDECIEPYVWRSIPSASGGDRICVTRARFDEVRAENNAHAGLIEPDPAKRPFGMNTCAQGYVWRTAFAGDETCVTAAKRDLARSENSTHFARTRVGANP